MDEQKVLELLKKVSADCDKSIVQGFGPGLNVLTIKKQIDDVIGLLVPKQNDDVKAEPESGEKVNSEGPGGAETQDNAGTEKKEEVTGEGEKSGNLTEKISEPPKEDKT
jgi:hypothetical protein